MLKKILLILFFAIIAVVVWYFTLLKNNDNLRSPFVRNGGEQETESDNYPGGSTGITTLRAVRLEVAQQYRTNTFSTERTVNLPDGFTIKIYAAGLNGPRSLDTDDAGNVYVTDKETGEVIILSDTNGNNIADEKAVVEEQLRNIHGIDWHNGNLYVGEEHQIIVYRNIKTDGTYDTKEVLVANLPAGAGHNTRTVKVGPDNKLYVSVGSSCNVCNENDKRRAAIVTYNIDGTGEEIFAEGLRNTVGFTFRGGELWGVDNGRDLIGDNVPPEELNLIEKGNHYGWPYCYGEGIANPEYPDRQDFCENESTFPKVEMMAHSAPLGLEFVPDTSEWTSFQGNVLIAFHGSWNRTEPTGYKLVMVDISGPEPVVSDFATGWLEENGQAWGRPVDVKFINDTTVLVTDDRAGAIYAIEKTR